MQILTLENKTFVMNDLPEEVDDLMHLRLIHVVILDLSFIQ